MAISFLKTLNIHQKLYLYVGGAILVGLTILGAIAVGRNAEAIRQKTSTDAQRVVEAQAQEIQRFFAERARIVETFLLNPTLHEYFSRYDSYRAPVLGDSDYTAIIDYLDAIVATDPTIKAVFYADEDSQDYFANRIPEIPDGRVTEDGYMVKSRPWWHEAVGEDRLYLASPTVDVVTKEVLVALQTTVYNANGVLLGVGGMDVLLTTVGEMVDQVRHEGEGSAFLVDGRGEIVFINAVDIPLETTLDVLDAERARTGGFAELSARIQNGDHSQTTVTWDGKDQVVLLAPVQSESPHLNWTLGLMVPESSFYAPVRKSILSNWLAVLFTIVFVGGLVLFVNRLIVTRPIRRLLERFEDVTGGEADLRRRVEVTSTDEIGRLGDRFNTFVSGIQNDVRTIGDQADGLMSSSGEMRNLSQQIASANEETSTQASMVSAAAEQVSANVQSVATATEELNANTREIASSASEAALVANQAVDIADNTRSTFDQLSESGNTIGNVVKVIYAIAEQTNMLALNATIEAARAGEAGKGFAVVADEVKKLASQTAQATEEISSTADVIGAHTKVAGEAIAEISNIIGKIHDIQTTIASGVEEQTATTAEIAHSVTEAATGSGEIAERIAGIAAAVQQTAMASTSSHERADELAEMAAQLKQIVGRFTY